MAKKGAKSSLEPIARRLYAEGNGLDKISRQLDVSVTSLARWKAETKDPNRDQDEWDRARLQRRSSLQRLKDLFERELEHAEEVTAGAISPASMDALSKLGALVQKMESVERAEAARLQEQTVAPEIDKPAVFLENMEWIVTQLKEIDPQGLKTLSGSFESLISRYKTEYAQTA